MSLRKSIAITLLAALALMLASCGGGGGVGSGGTGLMAGGGVGSGGTGISIGPVTGFGSIFVNGVEYDTSGATLDIEDASELQLGMTVEVSGSVNGDFTAGTAARIVSAADLRGPVDLLDASGNSLRLLGTTVVVDSTTVYSGVSGFGDLVLGDVLQVYGLLDAPGMLRATRLEKLGSGASQVVSGTVTDLLPIQQTFKLGALTVDYAGAVLLGGLSPDQLAEGLQVRVRASTASGGGTLVATQLRTWYTNPQPNAAVASLSAPVTDFASLADFRLLGVRVDASNATVSGGQASVIGNGVTVDASGTMRDGTLVAARLKIRHAPGGGGASAFNLQGAVGAFVSLADFRVQGRRVDASGPSVTANGGTLGSLGNGMRVNIVGARVVDGVLIAEQVNFLP